MMSDGGEVLVPPAPDELDWERLLEERMAKLPTISSEDLNEFTHFYRIMKGANDEHEELAQGSGSTPTDADVVDYEVLGPANHRYYEVKRVLSRVVVSRTMLDAVDEHLPSLIQQIKALNHYYNCNIPLLLVIPWNGLACAESIVANQCATLPVQYLVQAKCPCLSENDLLPPTQLYHRFYSMSSGILLMSPRNVSVMSMYANQGRKYLFVADSRNNTPILDLRILEYLKTHKKDFLLEVFKKHPDEEAAVLRKLNGRLKLTYAPNINSQEDENSALSSNNNIWLNLRHLTKYIEEGRINLKPFIRNDMFHCSKNLNEAQLDLKEIQYSIELFENACAVRVSSSRLIETSDKIWSDNWHLHKLARLMNASPRSKLSVATGLLLFFLAYHVVLGGADVLTISKIESEVAREWAKGACWLVASIFYVCMVTTRRWAEMRRTKYHLNEMFLQQMSKPRKRSRGSDALQVCLATITRFLCNGITKSCEETPWFKKRIALIVPMVHVIAFCIELVGCFFIEWYVGEGFREPVESY